MEALNVRELIANKRVVDTVATPRLRPGFPNPPLHVAPGRHVPAGR